MTYEDQEFKVPVQSDDYPECSRFVTTTIEAIIKKAIERGENKIFINTNLRLGLPMENINKIAGPFVEAWAAQTFDDVLQDNMGFLPTARPQVSEIRTPVVRAVARSGKP